MTNLIPEVRVNKNGVPVTRHVKPEAVRGGKGSIPSPAIPAKAKKSAFKLWAGQQELRSKALDRITFRPREEILKALSFKNRGGQYDYHASDEAAYGMFSIMGVNEAIHMIHFGINTKDDALDFIESHGLNSLLQDNSGMMQAALERRIPALNLVALHGEYGMHGHLPGLFLDAVEAYSSGTLRSLDNPTSLNSVHLRVLSGDLSLADIKTVGISRIQKSNAAIPVINALQFIKKGSLECTANDIRQLIDKNNDDNSDSAPLKWALDSINTYGVDFLLGVNRLVSAKFIAEYEKGTPVPEIKELITYEGIMRENGRTGTYTNVRVLKKSGIDPALAGRLAAQNVSVERIIGSHGDDVPVAVSGGWL